MVESTNPLKTNGSKKRRNHRQKSSFCSRMARFWPPSAKPLPPPRALIPDPWHAISDTRTSGGCPNRTKNERISCRNEAVRDHFPQLHPSGRSPRGSAPSLPASLAAMLDVHSAVLGRDGIRVAVQQQADCPACPHIIPQRIWELGGEMSLDGYSLPILGPPPLVRISLVSGKPAGTAMP